MERNEQLRVIRGLMTHLDNGTNGVSIIDNVFHRVGEGEDGWAVMLHGGGHNTIERNTFVDCPVPLHVGYW